MAIASIKATFDKLTTDDMGNAYISFAVDRKDRRKANLAAQRIRDKDKPLRVEISWFRNRRSLSANAYMWLLLDKLADALDSSKDEVYLHMLERYGKFTYLVVKPTAVEHMKREWRTVKELGDIEINGQTGTQLQCYFGSSTYDTKEMARLVDGIISECKELEIETDAGINIDWSEHEKHNSNR